MNNCNCQTPGTVVAPNFNTASACATPPTQLRTVTIPKSQGGDGKNEPYAPQLGAYRNTVVVYLKTQAVYIYDVNGVYTSLTGTDWGTEIAQITDELSQMGMTLETTAANLDKEVQDRIAANTALSNQLTALSNSLTTETQARTTADTQLQEQISAAQTQLNQIGTKVDAQGEILTADVAALQTNINQLANKEAEDVADLQENINKNATDIAALQAGAGSESEAFTKELVLDLAVAEPLANQVNLTATMGNLGTDETTTTTLSLPVASAEQAGILTADDYAKLDAAEAGGITWDEVSNWLATGWDTQQSLSVSAGYQLSLRGKDNTGLQTARSISLPNATTTTNGAMSATDKTKLNGLPSKIIIGRLTPAIGDGVEGEAKATFGYTFTSKPVVFIQPEFTDTTSTTTTPGAYPDLWVSDITTTGFTLDYDNNTGKNWNTGTDPRTMYVQYIAIGN